MFRANQLRQPFQILIIDSAILKYIGCYDHLPCAHIQKLFGIVRGNPPADLQPLRICRKCQLRLFHICLVIGASDRIQQDDMSARKSAPPVQICIEICFQFRDEIILGKIRLVLQAATDDLLDRAVMYINTRSKPHSTLLLCFSLFFLKP